MLIRAEQRFRTEHDGIVSLHCFSAGAHYDPERMGVGPLVAVDEHLLAPGAGFTEHAHRGVDIVSRVVAGTLRHDALGETVLVGAGQLLVQRCGDGIRHTEANASTHEPLRFIQLTALAGDSLAGDSAVSVLTDDATPLEEPLWFVHVVTGAATVGDVALAPGDSLSGRRQATVRVEGDALVWRA